MKNVPKILMQLMNGNDNQQSTNNTMSEEENDSMTQAQRDAICKAYSILGEHFDEILIAVNYEINVDDKIQEAHEAYWKGGAITAIGLAEWAKDRLIHCGERHSDPSDT
jgi:2-hydroxy-3-keto-5-methylthiopentenyl-1-phosphate phosphatase